MDIQLISETALTEAMLLIAAFLLSAVIGVERELRMKSAGARTHILVGLGSALFTLVSASGFAPLLGSDMVLDPSRIAAQIVTGIGFLGAGVIFVRQNIVSGLTTAASIWVTAAVGMACGAGMPVLAGLTVGLHLLTVTVVTPLVRRLPHRDRERVFQVRYLDGRGVLRELLGEATEMGYETRLAATQRRETPQGDAVEATMRFSGPRGADLDGLFHRLSEIPHVLEVRAVPSEHD